MRGPGERSPDPPPPPHSIQGPRGGTRAEARPVETSSSSESSSDGSPQSDSGRAELVRREPQGGEPTPNGHASGERGGGGWRRISEIIQHRVHLCQQPPLLMPRMDKGTEGRGGEISEPKRASRATDNAQIGDTGGVDGGTESWTPPPHAHTAQPTAMQPPPPPPGYKPHQRDNQPPMRGERSNRRLFPKEKQCHQPSGKTPYPYNKVHLVLVVLPGTDRDPHSGHYLCAPKRQGRHKHRVPRHVHVPAGGGVAGEGSEAIAETNKENSPEQWLPGEGGTIAGLLRDWALLAINRPWGPVREVRRVIHDIIAILKVLVVGDLDEED